MKKETKQNNGFTLVETLVALAIFTTSVLGLLAVVTQSISSIDFAKKKMIATYLGQEGIEYMRNMRDTFVLHGSPQDSQAGWVAFKDKVTNGGCSGVDGCYFNDASLNYADPVQPITKISIISCPASPGCPRLLYHAQTGKYRYTTPGVNSGFIRQIKTNIGVDEVKVSSTVFWSQGAGTKSVTFSESLFNWIE